MIRVVVDANIILSALLGGSARFVLFDPRFEFVTAEFTIAEVEHYLPKLAARSGVPGGELSGALALLPLVVENRRYYRRMLPRARRMLRGIDPQDADLLALCLVERTYLWSEDRDFEKVRPSVRLLKTKDFF